MTKLLIFHNGWKLLFDKEKENLKKILRKQNISSIEHVGSTSVVMCKAAGTIDIVISIPDMIEMFTIKNLLVKNGYRFIKSMSDEKVLVFMRVENGRVVCSIKLMEHACDFYNDILLFKHYLRANKKNVIKYNEYREVLLQQCNGDGKKYHEGKIDYIVNKLAEIKPKE